MDPEKDKISVAEIETTIKGSRTSESNKIITETMSLKLDEGHELTFTMKYDPGSLLNDRHSVEIEHNATPLGKINWEFELEQFLARLLNVWGVYYRAEATIYVPPPPAEESLTQLEEIHKPGDEQ